MPNPDDFDKLEERLIGFAVRIIKLVDSLPRTPAGRHIGGQLLRCGTSAAPNYAEARGAESHNDFTHKMGIVSKELNESYVWLRILHKSEIVKPKLLSDLMAESQQLCRIFTSSLKTAKSKRKASLQA